MGNIKSRWQISRCPHNGAAAVEKRPTRSWKTAGIALRGLNGNIRFRLTLVKFAQPATKAVEGRRTPKHWRAIGE